MSRKPGDLILKDPDSIEPEGFDWTAWLAELGASVTIATSAWSVTPTTLSPLTATSPSIVTGSLMTQVKLSGGLVGTRYTVTNEIVASDGSRDDRSFVVLVQDR